MTRDEAVTEIQAQLGFRTDQTAFIIRQLKFAQTVLESGPTKPWFMISEQHYIRTTVNEERLILPEGFIQELDEARLVYIPDSDADDTTPVDLRKDEYDVLAAHYKDALVGPPEAYALLGQYFRLFPTPDDLYLIKMIFAEEQDILSTNIENNWLKYAPLLLMGVAGQFVATALRDTGAKAIFREWEMLGRDQLARENTSRAVANTTPQIGGPH